MLNHDRLKKRLLIDKFALDDEIVEQSSLLFEVAEAYVEAVAQRDTLKEQLSAIDAELDGEIRLDLETSNLKATEATVKAEIQLHKKHKRAFEAYIQAKTEADKLAALKEAFSDRSKLVNKLADLYIANYWDKSSVQGTSSKDKVVYEGQRRIMEQARGRRAEK